MRRLGMLALAALLCVVFAACQRGERSTTTPLGDSKGSLSFGGLTRTYLLHLPPSYSATKLLPLVLALHGGGGTGQGMERLTHLSTVANQQGFIVVYPDGYQKAKPLLWRYIVYLALDLARALLEIAPGLFRPAFGLHTLFSGHLADHFLHLAAYLLRLPTQRIFVALHARVPVPRLVSIPITHSSSSGPRQPSVAELPCLTTSTRLTR
jgi:hypothetical protein